MGILNKSINMSNFQHNQVYVTYVPRWNKFHPKFKWYTRWAYKIQALNYNRNQYSYSKDVLYGVIRDNNEILDNNFLIEK